MGLVEDVGIGVKGRGTTSESARKTPPMTSPAAERQLEHPPRRGEGLVGVAGAQGAPDDDLPGDGDGVEHEGEQAEELEGDLVGGDGRRADARADGGGEHEAPQQCRGAHDELGADRHEAADADEVGERERAQQHGREGAPIPSCASTVPQADPSSPQPKP